MLICLNKIIIMSNESEIREVSEAANIDDEFFPECMDFENDTTLGCYWCQASSIVINFKAIQKEVGEMEAEAEKEMVPFNYGKELSIGLYTTITHEIRHLGLDNPFLPEDDYPSIPANYEEAGVEKWGIEAFESWWFKHPKGKQE